MAVAKALMRRWVVRAHGRYIVGFSWRGATFWGCSTDALLFDSRPRQVLIGCLDKNLDLASKVIRDNPCAAAVEVVLSERDGDQA